MPALDADRYLAAFHSRVEYCRALLKLSTEQQELIASGDYSGLIELLTHKQQLIDALLNPREDQADLWQGWREHRQYLGDAERQACEAALDDADRLLKQLMTLEASSTEQLTSRRAATETALREINHGGLAVAGYLSPEEATAGSRRLDLDL